MNPDFLDMLSAFFEEKVEFLVVGAYAMAAHGYVRSTGDIDLWIRPTPENADRVWQALARFGAPRTNLTRTDLFKPDVVYQIGIPPRRIDILTSIAGVKFEDAWQERLEISLDHRLTPVLGRSCLIQNKRATGRPKDAADVIWLEEPTLPGD